MRQIKFRGRDIDTNEDVYFDLEDILLDVAGAYPEYVCLHNVDPESVAQLGDVIDGVEYYEGEERIIDGVTHVCSLTVQWETKS